MWDRITEVFASKSYDFPALLNAVAVWLWGVWLLLPFGTYPAASHLNTFENFIPESVLGMFSVIVAMVSAYSILTLKDKGMKWGMAGVFYFWIFISIGAITASWQSPTTVVYPLLALFSGWIWAQSHS